MAEIVRKFLDRRSIIPDIKFLYGNCYTDWNYPVLTGKNRLSSKMDIKEEYREMRAQTHEFVHFRNRWTWVVSFTLRLSEPWNAAFSIHWLKGWVGLEALWKFSVSSGNLTSDPTYQKLRELNTVNLEAALALEIPGSVSKYDLLQLLLVTPTESNSWTTWFSERRY
jgi:hypothetical protein